MAIVGQLAYPLPPTGLSHLYTHRQQHANNSAISPAQAAFEEGTRIFEQMLTKDPRKRQLLADLKTCSLQEVLNVVAAARDRYQDQKESSKFRSAITSFSHRLHYYSNVVDVFASSHPEYAALAWGMMKLLFGGVVEHDRTNSTLLAALNDVSESLPRIELAMNLYPSDMMQGAVAKLYSCIIRLLLRALQWYEEGKLAHAIHAVTRPVALRYTDLIAECRSNTETIKNLANLSSQAEIRDMHGSLSTLQRTTETAIREWRQDRDMTGSQLDMIGSQLSALAMLVERVQDDLAKDRVTASVAHFNIDNRLSDIQFVQSLDHISTRCSIDHKATLHRSLLSYGRQRRTSRTSDIPFWIMDKLEEWNKSSSSSSVFLKGTHQERVVVRSLCAAVIQQLLSGPTAVLYVLQDQGRTYSLHEILQSLILQCLSSKSSALRQPSDASVVRRFCEARLDKDYVTLLCQLLEHLGTVFIIVNAESMEPDAAVECRSVLRDVSRSLADRKANTVIRVLTTSQSPRHPADVMVDDTILRFGGVRGQRQRSRVAIEGARPKRLSEHDALANLWRTRKRMRT